MPDNDSARPDDEQKRGAGRGAAGAGERPGALPEEPARATKIPRQGDGPPALPAGAGPQAEHRPRTEDRPQGGAGRLGDEQVQRLTAQWRAVQTGFVDDPRDAVSRADELVARAAGLLVTSLDERRRRLRGEDGADDSDAGIPTEELRLAMREYHTLLDRLLAV